VHDSCTLASLHLSPAPYNLLAFLTHCRHVQAAYSASHCCCCHALSVLKCSITNHQQDAPTKGLSASSAGSFALGLCRCSAQIGRSGSGSPAVRLQGERRWLPSAAVMARCAKQEVLYKNVGQTLTSHPFQVQVLVVAQGWQHCREALHTPHTGAPLHVAVPVSVAFCPQLGSCQMVARVQGCSLPQGEWWEGGRSWSTSQGWRS